HRQDFGASCPTRSGHGADRMPIEFAAAVSPHEFSPVRDTGAGSKPEMADENDDKTTPTPDTSPAQPVTGGTLAADAGAEAVEPAPGALPAAEAAAEVHAPDAEAPVVQDAEAQGEAEAPVAQDAEAPAEPEAPAAASEGETAASGASAEENAPAEPEAPAEPGAPKPVTAVSLGLLPEVFVSKVSTQLHFYAPEIVPLPAASHDDDGDDERGSGSSRRGGRR